MVYDVYGLGLGKWKDGEEPVSKQQIQLGVENERAGAGTGRTSLSHETKSSGANGDRKSLFFLFR